MALLFNSSSTDNVTLSTLKKELLYSRTRCQDAEKKLGEAQSFITLLETSLEESTRTINALNLVIDMNETGVLKEHEEKLLLVKKELTDKVEEVNLWMQKATRLQSNVDELEVEIDASVELIQNFGVSLRKN